MIYLKHVSEIIILSIQMFKILRYNTNVTGIDKFSGESDFIYVSNSPRYYICTQTACICVIFVMSFRLLIFLFVATRIRLIYLGSKIISQYDMGFYCFLMVISVVIKIGQFDLFVEMVLWGRKRLHYKFSGIYKW